jgi:hypothetical protein
LETISHKVVSRTIEVEVVLPVEAPSVEVVLPVEAPSIPVKQIVSSEEHAARVQRLKEIHKNMLNKRIL